MAREYARYLVSNHDDSDWFAMTCVQHDCYMALTSSPDLSWAGVVPLVPARFARISADLTERRVVRTWAELEALNKIIIDESTGEILVRTFLRHDNVLAKPNIAKAFCRAFDLVKSDIIRRAITAEVARLYDEHSEEWGGTWDAIAERLPELFEAAIGKP